MQLPKGVALVDSSTYEALLPEEKVELKFLGFKVSCAVVDSKHEA